MERKLSNYVLELLEPRVLLSGDGLMPVPAEALASAANETAVVVESHSAAEVAAGAPGVSQADLFLGLEATDLQSDTPLNEKNHAFAPPGNVDILGVAKSAIDSGLGTLASIGSKLNELSAFVHTLPLVGDQLSHFIDSGAAITNVFQQQIHNLFTGALNTAENAVTNAIQSWNGASFGGFTVTLNSLVPHYDVTGSGPFWWEIDMDLTPAAANRGLQNVLGSVLGATFSGAPSVAVNSKLNLDFGFGYDAGFFVQIDDITAQASVNVSGLNAFPFNFAAPLASLSVTNGSVNLTASITATPDPSKLTPNATTGPRIPISALTTIAASVSNVSDAFNLAKTSSLNASFTLNASLSGLPFAFTGVTTVNYQSNDLFSGAAPDVTVAVNGSLKVLNETLTGLFTFKKTATETVLLANGVTLNLNLGPGGGVRVLQATGSGVFRLMGNDLAGTASLTLTNGPAIPGVTLSGTTLNLAFNTSPGPVSAIDGNAVSLPSGPYYRISGHGIIGLATPAVNLEADFVFEPKDTNANPADGDEEVQVGVANFAFNFNNGTSALLNVTNGAGAFVFTQSGMFGAATVAAALNVPGVTVTGSFGVRVNTAGVSVAGRTLNVNGANVTIPALGAGPYLQVAASGASPGDHAQVTVLGIALRGDFLFESKTTNAASKVVTVAASNMSFDLGTVTTSNILQITNGSGAFLITSAGLAGQGSITVGVNAQDVTVGGTFTFRINQTGSAVNETVNVGGSPIVINLPSGPYLQVAASGATLSFLGAGLTGDFSFEQKTSTTGTRFVTVLASNVSFSFGTSILSATNGSGFFIIDDTGIIGAGQIDVHVAAFGGLSHTFTWDFNNTDPAIDELVDVGGIQRRLTEPDGPFNRLSSGGPIPLSVDVGGRTQSITAAVVLTLVHPDSDPNHDYVTVGVSDFSTSLGASGVTLTVGGGVGAFVINKASPGKVAGEVTVAIATLNLPASVASINATNLKVRFNNTGTDVGPVSVAIDDNPANNVTLQFTGLYYHDYISVSGAAEILLPAGFAALGGNFAFEISNSDANQLKVAASDLHLDLQAGSTTIVSFNHGQGEFLITNGGVAGTATLQFQSGVIGMSGTIGLEVNTTSGPIITSVTTPAGIVPINLATPNFFKVSVNGQLQIGSLSLPFNFYILINGSNVEVWRQSPNDILLSVDANGHVNLGLALSSFTNIDFAQAGPFEFVSMLQQLGTWIEAFRGASIFDVEIPFTGGTTLGDAFDWTQLFVDDLYSHLVSVELQSTTIKVGQASFTTTPATLQLQLDSGAPSFVTIPAIGSFGATFTDANIQSIATTINTALASAHVSVDHAPGGLINLTSKIVARENLAGQLVIALTDAEVAKGTRLATVAADAQADKLGFGPVDASDVTQEHVAVLTARYSTDGSGGSIGLMTVLSDLLNDGVINNNGTVSYQPAQQVYTFDVDSTKFLPAAYALDVPLSFEEDFGPLGGIELNGKLHISASVGFHFTLGFDLGAREVPRILSSSAVPVPANGRLSADAHFQLYINGDAPLPVITLARGDTTGNNSIDDLAADLNLLFANPLTPKWNGISLSDVLIAQKAGSGLAISAKSSQLGIVNRLAVVSPKNDIFATEMGFGMQLSQDEQFFLSASNATIKGLFIDHANLSAALSVAPDLVYNPNGISGSLRFGFVDVNVPSGTVQFVNSDPAHPTALTATVALQDHTTNATRFYISDLMNGTSSNNIPNMVSGPNLAGGFRLQLNNISVGGLGFSLPLGPNPTVEVFVPDVKDLTFNPNPYNAATNNTGLFLTYPNLGALQNFTNLNFSQIIQALKIISDNLSQLSAFSFLNERLPLIDISINDLIGYAAKFASLLDAAANGGAQSLQETIAELKSQIDNVFHLSPNILAIDIKGINPLTLMTTGGDATHAPHSGTINPEGDNNDFTITGNSNGASLNGSVIQIVGSSDVVGTSAQASWDAGTKVLKIKINPGKTTANAIIAALAGTPWTGAHTATDNAKPNSGNGSVSTTALKFSFNFTTGYANTLPFELDLQKLVRQLGGTSPAVQALLEAATTLLDISGSGTLTVNASAELKLDFGLDLTNPGTVRPFFYDSTGVVLRAKVLGTNIDFQASLGSVVGIYIENGSVTLDGDGDPGTNANSPVPDKGAEFRLGLLDNNGDGRHYLDEDWFNSSNIDLHLKGGVSAVLPIYAPLQGQPLGSTSDNNHDGFPDNDLIIQIPDLVRLFLSDTASVTAVGADATVLFAGTNNDLFIHSATHANYGVKFVSNLSGNVANANFDVPSNTLTVQVDGANTTALTALNAIKAQAGFNTSALTSDDDGNPAAPHTNSGAGKLAKVFLAAPDFSELFAGLDFCEVIASATGPLLNGLDALLGKIQDGLNSIVSSTKLPLIGDGLSGAANFIQSFRNGLLKELRDAVAAAGGNGVTAVENAIKKAFWNTLGPGGLDILVNAETGDPLDASLGFSQLDVKLDCDTGLAVNLRFKKELALVDTTANPIKFDIGVPGFGLSADGNVIVSIGFDLKFGFGVSPEEGFYFNSAAPEEDPELQIYFRVTIPSLHFSGQLLFLQLDIADNAASPSIFEGHFAVDLKDPNDDGKLTFAELTSSGTQLSSILHAELGADARVNLDLIASFGGNAAFPRVLAQFHLLWHFDIENGADSPRISFDHVYLDLGSFLSDFLAPVLKKIQEVTAPVQPIIDIVTARLPVLSDLAGETITLLDLARIFGLLEPSTVDFIRDVLKVVTLINSLEGLGEGTILIPFGSFSLGTDSSGNMSKVNPLQNIGKINLGQAIANASGPGVSSTYQSASAGFASDVGSLSNFSIPVFDHPTELFNLFIGKPVRLVEWRMPQFKFEFTYVQKIPIYPPLYAQFGGKIGATINVGFGYDTFGIQKFIDDPKKDPINLLDGFYVITNDANGQPMPALTLTGEIFAGASIDLGIVEVGVRGGISATISFYWNDNADNDGKMRVSEIITNALEDARCIFNIHGEISLFLEAYLKVDLFFFSIDKTWRFANITLISFDLSCPEPVLAELSGSTLTLNIGSRSALRENHDTSDGPENFVIRHVDGDASGGETIDITWAQHRQQFTGVKVIEVPDAGQGDDVLDFRNILVTVHVQGGSGDDTIYLSDGPNSTADGGAGDDKIVASKKAAATGVVIHGGDGNDSITAGTVSITIYGDEGQDSIVGSPMTDLLYGGGGADLITAGLGDDFVDGGGGSDSINAGEGNDFVLAGAGDDEVNAGAGNDIVDAGDGHDLVFGGSGNDVLIGGNGNDRLTGDGGTDLLIGDKVTSVAGIPISYSVANVAALNAAAGAIPTAGGVAVQGIYGPDDGSAGDDFLVGGGAADLMFGGNGDDYLYGGNFFTKGDTSPIEEDDNDFQDGGPGDDVIFGDDSMGRTGDRNTGIAIKSSVWYDIATGGTPNGIRDADEQGLGGVTVWLYTASTPPPLALPPGSGSPIATTETDVDGTFQFVGLDPNHYIIVFSLPPTLAFTTQNSADVVASSSDSDASPATTATRVLGETGIFFLDYETTLKSVSAGYTGDARVSIADTSVKEGNAGPASLVFTVTLSSPQAAPVEITYLTANGNDGDAFKNAIWETGDYAAVALPRKITLSPGETSREITIQVNGDNTYENNQQLRLLVSARRLDPNHITTALEVNNAGGTVTVLGTILNDDSVPTIAIQDYNPAEADPRFTVSDFVKLSNLIQTLSTSADPVSVFIWSHVTPEDKQMLTSAASSDAQKRLALLGALNLLLEGPSIHTPARFASVVLSHATTVLLGSGPSGAALVLLNRLLLQDAYPAALARTVASDTEGATARFIVTLSNPSEYTITTDWRTDAALTRTGQPEEDSATPSPFLGADFTSTFGTFGDAGHPALTFQPGQTTQVLTVATNNDTLSEGTERFWVELFNPRFATVQDPRGFGFLVDNDPLPSVTIVPVTPIGGPFRTEKVKDPISPVSVSFDVTLSAPSGQTITITWATSPGTAVENLPKGAANYPDLPDYAGFPTSTTPDNEKVLVFRPGDPLTKTISVQINPTKPYPNPTDTKDFFVNLLGVENAVIAARPNIESNHVTVVIKQPAVPATDQGPWSVFFEANAYQAQEPAAGFTAVDVTIHRTPGSSNAVAVFYTTNGTATAGADYASVFRQLVRFGDNELSKKIPIIIYADSSVEGDETVILSLRNPTGGPVRGAPDTAVLTIHDGNTPYIWIEAPRLGAGFSSSSFADLSGLVAKLTAHADPVSTFLWNGFTAAHRTVLSDSSSSVAALEAALIPELTLVLLGSSIFNPVRFAEVPLSRSTINLMNQTPAPSGGDLVRLNRWLLEDAYTAEIVKSTGVIEGSGLISTNRNFVVHLSAPVASGDVFVSYETVGLTARSDLGPSSDFTAVSGLLHFTAGMSQLTVSVPVYQDQTSELSETFAVRLKNPIGAMMDARDSAAVATIYDDDLKQVSFTIFYDKNGNGFDDLGEKGMAGLAPAIKVSYFNAGAKMNAPVVDAGGGLYTADVLLGQVGLIVNGDTVNTLKGAGSSYKNTTKNENQSIKYQGLVGLPSFAEVGYIITQTKAVEKAGTKDVGRGGTDDTIFGGPGDDDIDAGAGDDHVVGGHWMTATDQNMPINDTSTFNKYDALVKAATSGLHVIYANGAGPVFFVDTSGLNLAGSISGEIWLDGNSNNLQDAGELFIGQDVLVTLFDCDGNVIDQKVTSTGVYAFTKLFVKASASEYVVQFELPKGYTFLGPNPAPPAPAATNNDVLVGGRTGIVSIVSGAPANYTITQLDAGIRVVGDTPVSGGLQFSDASYSVSEAVVGGKLTVTVQRGNAFSDQAVIVRTKDGTAVQGINYAKISIFLQFNAGETIKTFDITIFDTDSIMFCTDPLIFTLEMRDPTGRPLDTATVYIGGQSYGSLHDDDHLQGGDDWDIILGDSGTIPAAAVMNAVGVPPVGLVNSAGLGNDTVFGGNGPDYIDGQLGKDTLSGDSGLDLVYGGMGNDTIYVTLDNDNVYGDYGYDSVISTRDVATIQLDGTSAPTVTLTHRDEVGAPLGTFTLHDVERVELFGGPSARSGGADNTFEITNWNGATFIVGYGGKDTLRVQNHVNMKLADATAFENFLYRLLYGFSKDAALVLASGSKYDLSSIENVFITVTGGAGGNTIDASGYSRPVTFADLDGNNTLIGGSGADLFVFDADTLLGTETVRGNGGADTLDFSASAIGVAVNLATLSPSAQTIKAGLFLKLMDKLENVTGGSGGDTLTGNDLDNVIIGGAGTDTLVGGAGNETYAFDTDNPQGAKTIVESILDLGFDTLDFSATTGRVINLNMSILGSAQVINPNLTLTLNGEGIEQVIGGQLDDVIRGNSNNNTLRGGLGNDLLDGKSGDDVLDGGTGNNTLLGGPGTDTVSEQGDTNFDLTNTRLSRASGPFETLEEIEVVNLTGGSHNNTFNLTGFTGAGKIMGGGGLDSLIVDADANFSLNDLSITISINLAPIALDSIEFALLTDGAGSHTLDASGYSGLPTLNGGEGNDVLIGGKRGGIVNGGPGNNSFVQTSDAILFVLQNNSLVVDLTSATGDDYFTTLTQIQNVTLNGGPGTNIFDLAGWTAGNATVNGLAGSLDAVRVQAPTVPAPGVSTVTVTTGSLSFSGGAAAITLNSIEVATITGTPGNDRLDASGFSGNVGFDGGAGDDVLIGGRGLSLLRGGPGDDRFIFQQFGALHSAYVLAGDGEDTLDFSAFSVAINVDLGVLNGFQFVAPGELNVNLFGATAEVENIVGSQGGGTLRGNALDNGFTVTGGANTINGLGGANTVLASANADFLLSNVQLRIGAVINNLANIQTVKLTGGSGDNTLDASAFTGVTRLEGGAGNDRLTGGSGRDVLLGGEGNDLLRGGPGDDTYLFNVESAQGEDTVDELAGGGSDSLDFSASHSVGVRVDLSLTGQQLVAPNLKLTLTLEVEKIVGTDQVDLLTGNALDNAFTGGGGNDIINGGAGVDIVAEADDASFVLADTSLQKYRTPAFTAHDLGDVAGLIVKLQNDSNAATQPVSNYLWTHLSSTARQVLTDATVSVEDKTAILVSELNQIIGTGEIYDAVRFAGVVLRADTTALKNRAPTGDDLIRLNRWLLDDTYTGLIVTSHELDTLASIEGASLTGGAGNDLLDASAFTLGSVVLFGMAGNDVLRGGFRTDGLSGGDGDDVLLGGAGADLLLGGLGDDRLDGSGAFDIDRGFADGNDSLRGGEGNDTYVFDLTTQPATPDQPTPPPAIPQGSDTILELFGGGAADTITGLGPAVLAVNLLTAAPQNFFDVDGNVILTLSLTNPGQVEFSL